jgi:hypothetical protein
MDVPMTTDGVKYTRYISQFIYSFTCIRRKKIAAKIATLNGPLQGASLPTSYQQVVFALLVPSCQQFWKNLLTVVTTLLILSDLLQDCSNKSDTVMNHDITILLQPCNILVIS